VGALPDWLLPLPDAEEMRSTDRWAIEQRGVPGIELMERAGTGVVRTVERLVGGGPAAVVCGKGNNGGDGLVVARLLREAGWPVTVVCVAPPQDFTGDARVNLERLPGDPPVRLDGSSWREREARATASFGAGALGAARVLVDALLGTGFKGEARGGVADAIAAINGLGTPVVCVDVPSGVDASTGVVTGPAVRGTVTVTFHAAKPGLWINPGKEHAGEVETIDIGIPRGAPVAPSIGLIEPVVLELLPRRHAGSTKFVSGHVLVVGGSRGLTGAPRMAAHASMRAGAGYVTAYVPASLQAVIAGAATPEIMTRGLPDNDGSLDPDAVGDVLEAASRGALALGPGLGRSERASAFARALASRAEPPMVLDADGLNAHAGHLGDLAHRTAGTVLTPHAGELGRLLSLESAAIERERLRHVRSAAEQSQSVVVLKGDDTLIADPAGRVAVSPGGAPGLATAGTGDVLTGVIGAALAQGLEPFAAAVAGVWLHIEAGREAARRLGAPEGVIATDVIAALPRARTPHTARPSGGASAPRDAMHGGEGDDR
jgi:NAD(P)H-hydrate epimerase